MAARSSTSEPSRAGRSSRAIPRTGRTWTRSASPAPAAGPRSSASTTSATPGSMPGSCRSRRSISARIPTTGGKWFPADFITESFPGQFRNWFYSMLAMGTVLRREPPFKMIFGYATLFAEDGRPMHKSAGNSIEFDEAADRMGVDVMRWMFAKARPEENILFGWHAADEARRELLILWNVYAFFVTYAQAHGLDPGRRGAAARRATGPRPLDPVARGRHGGRRRGAAPRRRCVRRDPGAVGLPRRTVDLVPAPVPAPLLAQRRPGRPGRGVRDAPRGAGRDRPDARPDPAVPGRVDVRQPRHDGRRRTPRTAST